MVQGTSAATVTDDNGKYSLNIKDKKANVVFSFTGFALQTISVNNRSVINVSMATDAKSLSEVVVTAFGIEKNKKALTYSTQVVSGKELTEAR